eukprot:7037814-Lingulodinium_polyedra.AAC.1
MAAKRETRGGGLLSLEGTTVARNACGIPGRSRSAQPKVGAVKRIPCTRITMIRLLDGGLGRFSPTNGWATG